MASTTLTRTPSSNGNQKTWTLSCWIKRTGLGGSPTVIDGYYGNQSRYATIYFDSNNKFNVFSGLYSTGASTSYLINYTTNRVFRDTNCWYHIVVAVDTTQATAGDRVKIYVNGVQETSFSTETQPSQNGDTFFNVTTSAMRIGQNGLDAVLSHVHWIDGTQYAASTFGSTDSTTGEWKINTSPSVTYGTNGFFILKDAGSVTDQSGNSNNLTVSAGTLTNTEDCPSNVFATLNPLTRMASVITLSHGNNTMTTDGSSVFVTATSTLAMSSGKYYFELKRIAERGLIGITNVETAKLNGTAQYYPGDTDNTNDYGYYSDDGYVYNNGSSSGSAVTWGNNDIVGCAVDLDNRKIYWHKNGTYINSGNPSAGTGGQSIPSDLTYYFAVSGYTSTTFQCNFGNGFFGTTAISSEGTNASGIGKFEYDVPTGYTALSTKGLNE